MGRLTKDLFVTGFGAVTSVGLTGPQTLAAVRAGLSGYEDEVQSDPFGQLQTVARIPANWRLKPSDGVWLTNMAARAIAEVLHEPETTAVLIAGPEGFREHPATQSWPNRDVVVSVSDKLERPTHPQSRQIEGGAAGLLAALTEASTLLARGDADHVILAGVDSYLNTADLKRLAAAERLSGDTNAQGLIPGEAAAAIRLSSKSQTARDMVIRAVGLGLEADPVTGTRQSQGRGMQDALEQLTSPETPEAEVEFLISNGNGERYLALEALIYRSRFYRTHRDYMPTAYPAMSVGEIGAAATPLCIGVIADSMSNGYAPGRTAICEIASESGPRAAAYLRAAA